MEEKCEICIMFFTSGGNGIVELDKLSCKDDALIYYREYKIIMFMT